MFTPHGDIQRGLCSRGSRLPFKGAAVGLGMGAVTVVCVSQCRHSEKSPSPSHTPQPRVPPLSWTALCSPHTLGLSPQLLGSIRDEHRYAHFCSQTRAVRPAHTETLPCLMGCGASGCIQTRDTRQPGRPALLEHTARALKHGHQSPQAGRVPDAGRWLGHWRLQEPPVGSHLRWGTVACTCHHRA